MTVSTDEEFAPAEDSIDWAESAADELSTLITAFFKRDVASIVVEDDPNTGGKVQKLKFTADIPKDFRRKATEALNNARHSFDQSVFAARNILTGRSAKSVYYPWSQNPTDLSRLLQTRGIDQRLWDTIRTHEPYPTSDLYAGGDDLIRTLATIANNKHTVGMMVNGLIAQTKFPNITGRTVHQLKVLNPQWDARKKEAELVRWVGDVEIDGDYQFKFVICLKDSRLAKPVDAMLAVRHFTQRAKEVCESIKAKCVELAS